MKHCSIENCSNKYKSKGFCSTHYVHYRHTLGPSQADRRPALCKDGKVYLLLGVDAKHGYTIIDLDKKYLEKHNWTLAGDGYPITWIDGKLKKLHHFIIGKPSKGLVVDHKDRNKLNNQASNLRFVSQGINCINKSMQSNNTSGMTGVTWDKRNQKWVAQMDVNGKHVFLGRYNSKEEAANIRTKAVEENSKFKEALTTN